MQDVVEQFATKVLSGCIYVSPMLVSKLKASAAAWTEFHYAGSPALWRQPAGHLSDSAERALQQLRDQLYVCEVDKAANTPCFVCPAYALLITKLRLEHSEDFELVAAPSAACLAAAADDLAVAHPELPTLLQADRPLPIMREAYKSHKDTAAWRNLTSAAGTCFSPINKAAALVCGLLMEQVDHYLATLASTIKAWHGGLSTRTNIRVRNAQEVVLNLPGAIHHDATADIAQCFERIPINADAADSLPAVYSWAAAKAFTTVAAAARQSTARSATNSVCIALRVADGTPRSARWHISRARTAQDTIYLEQQQVVSMLTAAVSHAYVAAFGNVYKQVTGIPMGTDYSPVSCDLYFSYYEAVAVQRISRAALDSCEKRQLLSEWQYVYRLMDDVRMVNAPRLTHILQQPQNVGDPRSHTWVYPACVTLEFTSCVCAISPPGNCSLCPGPSTLPAQTQYLDVLTTIQPGGQYSFQIYNKTEKLPFAPIQYTALASDRPVTNAYKLIIGMSYRACYLSSSAELAANSIFDVMQILSMRGYNINKLLMVLVGWCRENPSLPGLTYPLIAMLTVLRRRLFQRRQSSS
jgi:hypothetical protein